MPEKIKITQTRSTIRRPKDQKDTLLALGLRGIRKSVVKEKSSAIMGMLAKISHLVSTEAVQ